MDANVMQTLFAVAIGLRLMPEQAPEALLTPVCHLTREKGRIDMDALTSPGLPAVQPAKQALRLEVMAIVAEDEELAVQPEGLHDNKDGRDIWEDPVTLGVIRRGHLNEEDLQQLSERQQKRVLRRAERYIAKGDSIYRRMPDGILKHVPTPALRAGIVRRIHKECGHWGRRKTTFLVALDYWWAGIYTDVRECVLNCQECKQVSATFHAARPELQPLPIMGMFYRWHMDLCGPFPKTRRGNTFIMIIVDAFSKHAKVIPMVNKEADTIAYHFQHTVLGHFGACAEIVSDQGTEFQGEFADLCNDNFIEHRTTSAYHPQGNGQAERCVQSIKSCLKRSIRPEVDDEEWDVKAAWIALGYRVTPQESTGIAPYQMLFAQTPSVPSSIRHKIFEPISFDDPEVAAAHLEARAILVARQVIAAGQNLRIAQKRDTLRYIRTHDGSYLPKLRRFEVGDFVYTKSTVDRTPPSGLRALANPEVLKVREVRPTGVLVLEGEMAPELRRTS